MDISGIKISVITPTYNDEKFIKQTIDSILNQTHKNIELIIVDDFSQDSTSEILKFFKDDRIRIFENKENRGAAYSRNLAIAESTGDYIAFLDGDDIWEINKLEEQLKFMIENNYLFSCTDYSIIDEEGCSLNTLVTAPKIVTHNKFLRMCYIGCLTAMYKRDVFPNLSIPDDIKKRNDYALWLKLSEKTPCFALNKTLSHYRKRTKNSISSGKKIGLLKYHKDLFDKLYRCGTFKAYAFAIRNVFYYFIKQIIYVKRMVKKL